MASAPRLICQELDKELEAGFAQIREELDVPAQFDPEVLEQAETAAARGPQLPSGAGGTEIGDHRDIPLVAIDPEGSRDLDQAFAAERRGDGYRVFYAIADLAAFITPGSALDAEARKRGVTLYSPDERASLHPVVLNEDVASLLPGQDRQSLLWTLDLDSDGLLIDSQLRRATVRSTRSMNYKTAQNEIDDGSATDSLKLLKVIGELRQEQERERGAVSLQLPSQEIVRSSDGYELQYDESLPVEGWNAQISLMTGIAAARIMIDGGEGLLRTLPPPQEDTIDRIRRTARALGVDWPAEQSYPDRVRLLTPSDPKQAALLSSAARGLRGAGYLAFHGGKIPKLHEHSAIASVYAHVTAPLRRVCDRFTNEIVLAMSEGRDSPAWATEALDELPVIMGKARQRDRALERTMIDYAESVWLQGRVGDTFEAVVTGRGRDDFTLMVTEPAVIARISASDLELGSTINVRLTSVNPDRRRLAFEPVAA